MVSFTVATPTFNRANVLSRVYESLNAQTYKNFEWIIIDDGSTDNTKQIVEEWQNKADYEIRYFYQENSGKHMALNLAVHQALGKFFVIADSDDSFKPESFETLLKYWEEIPISIRNEFRGVTCRCYDPKTGNSIGDKFPNDVHDILGIESSFKYRYHFEMWGFNRTDVMKEYPFPDTRGEGLAFYPETIIWQKMGIKYKVRFINAPLRAYYRDQGNAATSRKRNRSKENIYLWAHYANDMLPYFWYTPMQFIKAFVGLSMDGLLLNKSPKDIIRMSQRPIAKMLTVLFFPAGYFLYLKRKQ